MTPHTNSTLAIALPTASASIMGTGPSTDILTLISAAVERGEHGCEADITSYAAASLAAEPNRSVWCSKSANGKSRVLRAKPNVNHSFLGARSYDLAYGPRDAPKPTTLIQVKYDKGVYKNNPGDEKGRTTNQPRNHALRDLLYMAVDLMGLGEGTECHMVAVVHRDNMVKSHRWLPFRSEAEWTLRCEPTAASDVYTQGGFLNEADRMIEPVTRRQINELFGTHWQTLGHGLFARPGVLEVRFRTRSQEVTDFTVIDWELTDVSLDGTGLSLSEWLP